MIYGVHIKVSIMLKVGEESCSYCFLVIFPFSKAFNAFCLFHLVLLFSSNACYHGTGLSVCSLVV